MLYRIEQNTHTHTTWVAETRNNFPLETLLGNEQFANWSFHADKTFHLQITDKHDSGKSNDVWI